MNGARLAFPSDRTLVVAELSANHGGSLQRALDTLEAAASCGVDAIKIQTYTPDSITIDCDRPEFIIPSGLWAGRTLYDLYREAHTPREWHEPLFMAARDLGLPLFSTPFDEDAVDFLEAFDVPAYKVASLEIGHLDLLARISRTQKPVILSTGLATLRDIATAVETVRSGWGGEDRGLCVLHCVSAYPAAPQFMNLRTIPHLGAAFGVVPGLSDHSRGTSVALTSVALGARVIEKHFVLDRNHKDADAAFSLTPEEMTELVAGVRVAEQALGRVQYGPTGSEGATAFHRRSLFIVEDMEAGEPFTRRNVRAIRPGHGLAPQDLPHILGRRANSRLTRGTPLTADLIGP